MTLHEGATAAYNQGKYDYALELVSNKDSPDLSLLRIKTLLRKGEYDRALTVADQFMAAKHNVATDLQRGQASAMRGYIASKIGEQNLAKRAYVDARAFLYSAGDSEAFLDLLIFQAKSALVYDVELAHRLASSAYRTGNLWHQACASEVFAFVHFASGNLPAFRDSHLHSYSAFSKTHVRDEYKIAANAYNFIHTALAINQNDTVAPIRKFADECVWSQRMVRFRTLAYASLAEAYKRRGDAAGLQHCVVQIKASSNSRLLDSLGYIIEAKHFDLLSNLGSAKIAYEAAIRSMNGRLHRFESRQEANVLMYGLQHLATLNPVASWQLLTDLNQIVKVHDLTPEARSHQDLMSIGTFGVIMNSIGNISEGCADCALAFETLIACGQPDNAMPFAISLAATTGRDYYMNFLSEQARVHPGGEADVHFRRLTAE